MSSYSACLFSGPDGPSIPGLPFHLVFPADPFSFLKTPYQHHQLKTGSLFIYRRDKPFGLTAILNERSTLSRHVFLKKTYLQVKAPENAVIPFAAQNIHISCANFSHQIIPSTMAGSLHACRLHWRTQCKLFGLTLVAPSRIIYKVDRDGFQISTCSFPFVRSAGLFCAGVFRFIYAHCLKEKQCNGWTARDLPSSIGADRALEKPRQGSDTITLGKIGKKT